jgi:hypothetical protein
LSQNRHFTHHPPAAEKAASGALAYVRRTLSDMGRPIYDDEEKIRMRRGTFLVLYDVLARTLRNPDARKETTPGKFEILFRFDEAEKRALNWLVGAIERGVPDAMSVKVPEMIAEHKQWIMSRPK